MKLVWVTRCVADYRIPVFEALQRAVGGCLRVVYSKMRTSDRANRKIQSTLGDSAVGLEGEWRMRGGYNAEEGTNRWFVLTYQSGLIRQIGSFRPDAVIGDGFLQWTYAAIWARLVWGTPLVVCYERTAHTERKAQWYRTGYRRLVIRSVDGMCCNGKLSLDYTRSLGMPLSRITTGQMAADTDNLGRQAAAVMDSRRREIRQSWGAQGTVFLYVGRLIALKGLNYLLEAWAMLERAMSGQATLVLIGGGPQEAALREQAARLGLTGVRFPGAVDYDELAPRYAAADAFVIPTLQDNWSLVVPEAMACGLPILCSRYNGCWPELVPDGRNGWVFDPLNVQDLFQCLRRCVEAKDRLRAMGEQSKVIVSGHTPARAAQSILRACQIAVEHRRNRPV